MTHSVKKVFRAFDTLFATKEQANELLVGWEHKEKVYERYVILSKEDASLYDFDNGVSSEEFYLYSSLEFAKEEMEELV